MNIDRFSVAMSRKSVAAGTVKKIEFNRLAELVM